ncbi:MAG: hypothetical protein WCY41_01595 [Candidatus Micrarchaeia archaeon]
MAENIKGRLKKMFLFYVGIEHESDTFGQKLVNSAIYASSDKMKAWQAKFEEGALVKCEEFAGRLGSLNMAVAIRDTVSLRQFIMDGVAGLKEYEVLRHDVPNHKKRSDAALYSTALSLMAIFKCYEKNWGEPLRHALKDEQVSFPELRDCISSWLRNTDSIQLNAAVKERNPGLVVDLLAYYSNLNNPADQLVVYSIIKQCSENSWREPLSKYLEKDAKTYPYFREDVKRTLDKMGPATDKDMESMMSKIKKKCQPAPVDAKKTMGCKLKH